MSSYVLNSSGQISLNAGSQVAINSLQLSSPLPLASGGVGASNQSDAQSNLGLAIGSNVQAWNASLDQISALSPSDGQVISYSAGSGAYVASAPEVYSADNSTLSLSANTFSVATGGITSTQLASGCVTSSALASQCVGAANLGSDVAGSGLSGGSGSSLSVADSVVQTSGNFNLAGVIQFQNSIQQQYSGQSGYVEYDQYELKTVDATVSSIATIAVPTNAVLFAYADVALCDDSMGVMAQFTCSAVLNNNDGSLTAGQLNSSSIYASNGALACAFAISGSNLVLNVTGVASTNIRWVANVKQVYAPRYTA